MKSIVFFYSYILLLWYVGYDDFISMNNVIVIVLITIISLLVLSLAYMKMNILEKFLLLISDKFIDFSVFLFFIFFIFYHLYIRVSDIIVFSVFLSSSIFIFCLTLTLFCFFHFYSVSLSVTLWYYLIWYDVLYNLILYMIIWYCAFMCNITECAIDNNI